MPVESDRGVARISLLDQPRDQTKSVREHNARDLDAMNGGRHAAPRFSTAASDRSDGAETPRSPDLETELDRLADALRELVVRARLRVAAWEGWDPCDEVAVAVLMDDDLELALSLSHDATIVEPEALPLQERPGAVSPAALSRTTSGCRATTRSSTFALPFGPPAPLLPVPQCRDADAHECRELRLAQAMSRAKQAHVGLGKAGRARGAALAPENHASSRTLASSSSNSSFFMDTRR